MLMLYMSPFTKGQQQLLQQWHPSVRHWPYNPNHIEYTDWWLLFSQPQLATYWLMLYSEHTRIVRELWDSYD